MNAEAKVDYAPGDPVLIKNIVSQLKSQGVFDQFRKECISDVDTKPAYQNLCHRVDGQVESYLSKVKWEPDLNKNQLRENIRKYVNECHFVEPGIARIVDQLVNPRINTVLVPKVEDIVYSYLGIERPVVEPSYESHLSQKANSYWNADHKIDDELHACRSKTNKSRKSESTKTNCEEADIKPKTSHLQNYEFNATASQDKVVSGSHDDTSISLTSIKTESSDEKTERDFESKTDFQNESFTSSATDRGDISKQETLDACSNIDSDEDDVSPPFELIVRSGVNRAESDHTLEISDSKSNAKSLETDFSNLETENDKLYRNLERICGDESMDSIGSSSSHHVAINEKYNRKLSSSLDIPKTPTINYETSDDSEDNWRKKSNSEGSRRESTDPGGEPSEAEFVDTSNFDSLTQKIVEDNREAVSSNPSQIIDGDNVSVPNSNSAENPVQKDQNKKKEDGESSKYKKSRERSSDSKSGDSKHRDRKHSEHRKEKDRSKSDRHDSSRSKERKSDRDKDRSNQNSKSESLKDNDHRERKDQKESARIDSDKKDRNQRSHSDDKKSKDRDTKNKDSNKSSSGSDKHKTSSRSKDESKDDKKKKSSSKHESSKDKEKNKNTPDKSKSRKQEGSDLKKSKTQCNTDEKKARTDRRSSDRDSNGPSSASSHSTHRSSSKLDKEKHSDKPKHSSSSSSSVSSSHKSKKSSDVNGGTRSALSSVTTNCEIRQNSESACNQPHTIENESIKLMAESETPTSEKLPESYDKQLSVLVSDFRNSDSIAPINRVDKNDIVEEVLQATNLFDRSNEVNGGGFVDAVTGNESNIKETSKIEKIIERKLSDSSITGVRTGSNMASPLKSKSLDLGELSIKKPKIAKNASDIFRIMELRKQYKEKMRLMQQQGKENANSEVRKDMLPLDREDKTTLGIFSPVSTIALKESVDNYISKALGENGTNVGKEEQLASSIIETITDVKLRIKRVDSCYELVNGECVVNELNGDTKNVSEDGGLTGYNNNNTNISNNNIKASKTECCDETSLSHTITPEQGANTAERSLSKMKAVDGISSRSAVGHNAVPMKSVESNIFEWDAATTKYTASNKAYEKQIFKGENDSLKAYVPTNLSDSLTTSCRSFNPSDRPYFSPEDNTNDVYYFEPPELKTSFINFVAKRIKESEELYLQNFSVNIKCPERHDNVFRSELGAIVRRKGRPDLLPSPVKYNSEIISNKTGDDKGIMLRIKKAFDLDLSPSSKQSSKRRKFELASRSERSAVSMSANSSLRTHEVTPTHDESSMANERSISINDTNISSDEIIEKAKKVAGATAKRKTLGIKRKLLHPAKQNIDSKLNQNALLNEPGDYLPPTILKMCKLNHNKSESVDEHPDVLIPNTSKQFKIVNNSPRNNGSLFHSQIPGDQNNQKSGCATETNSADKNRLSVQETETPKIQRRASVVKQYYSQVSKEADSKRKQFYYDEGDLYKPRPSFLLSSRRSRPINTENIK